MLKKNLKSVFTVYHYVVGSDIDPDVKDVICKTVEEEDDSFTNFSTYIEKFQNNYPIDTINGQKWKNKVKKLHLYGIECNFNGEDSFYDPEQGIYFNDVCEFFLKKFTSFKAKLDDNDTILIVNVKLFWRMHLFFYAFSPRRKEDSEIFEKEVTTISEALKKFSSDETDLKLIDTTPFYQYQDSDRLNNMTLNIPNRGCLKVDEVIMYITGHGMFDDEGKLCVTSDENTTLNPVRYLIDRFKIVGTLPICTIVLDYCTIKDARRYYSSIISEYKIRLMLIFPSGETKYGDFFKQDVTNRNYIFFKTDDFKGKVFDKFFSSSFNSLDFELVYDDTKLPVKFFRNIHFKKNEYIEEFVRGIKNNESGGKRKEYMGQHLRKLKGIPNTNYEEYRVWRELNLTIKNEQLTKEFFRIGIFLDEDRSILFDIIQRKKKNRSVKEDDNIVEILKSWYINPEIKKFLTKKSFKKTHRKSKKRKYEKKIENIKKRLNNIKENRESLENMFKKIWHKLGELDQKVMNEVPPNIVNINDAEIKELIMKDNERELLKSIKTVGENVQNSNYKEKQRIYEGIEGFMKKYDSIQMSLHKYLFGGFYRVIFEKINGKTCNIYYTLTHFNGTNPFYRLNPNKIKV